MAFTCLRIFFFARVISTTISIPSTFEARIRASDRPSRGGESKITTSAPQFANAEHSRSMALEASNSGGLGGNGPAGMTRKLGIAVICTYVSKEKPGGSVGLRE